MQTGFANPRLKNPAGNTTEPPARSAWCGSIQKRTMRGAPATNFFRALLSPEINGLLISDTSHRVRPSQTPIIETAHPDEEPLDETRKPRAIKLIFQTYTGCMCSFSRW